MPPPLVATLDLDDPNRTAYAACINAIRDHVATVQGDRIQVSADRQVRMYRLRQSHRRDSSESMFVVRLRAGGEDLVDWYIQDTDLYGWGFTLTGQTDFYHLSNPTAGVGAMAAEEGFALHDTGIREGYGTDGIPQARLGWANLHTALLQLREQPGVRDYQRAAMGFLVEMVCEATRFRMIAGTLAGIWATSGEISDGQRNEITEAETNWSSLSGLFDRYNNAPGEPVPDTTTLTQAYRDLAAVALAVTILHRRPGGQPGPSTSGAGTARPGAVADVSRPGRRLYPVLDAGGNLPDGHGAYFFRPGTSLNYNLNTDAIDSGPHPFASDFPLLKDTDFALRTDALVAVPGSSTDVWMFSGHQYVRYQVGTRNIVGGPREIAAGWPVLGTTSFVDYIDAAVQDPGDPTRGLFLFRDSEVLYYHLDNDTITGPNPIAQHMPGLANTPFAHGVSVALTVPGSTDQLWLFRGDDYVRYNIQTHTIEVGPKRVHEGWASLRRKTFVDGVSAVLPCTGGVTPTEVWMFHDDLYLRFHLANNTVTKEAATVASGWPHLDTNGFADRVDATIPRPEEVGQPAAAWFFHDDQYLRYDLENSRVDVGPRPIADGWTGLKGTGFEYGIDAALPDPTNPNTVWIFSGDQYVHYHLKEDELVIGPTPIAERWKGLVEPFTRRIDAACVAPGSNDAWLFSGDSYIRYNPQEDKIHVGPRRIIDGWNLGFPT
ncbi:hemopexin repeat-containing protein [Streptomyces griseocarneus]|uniref:hemopexin repeat-containing protein n=1 Tax=Streptomyces griseocarneus TaxID=51201 RepID=UPI00167CD459|nr:hemopexin repeat-containing protein [Streptomyces griseocarneus]MBZ6475119.1 hemopexin repeat-containing protein [Streptomyces griseocarneus]GHG62155.1 hypothetical protein GCM10018779_30610 [Streptomyces griseocarneus]